MKCNLIISPSLINRLTSTPGPDHSVHLKVTTLNDVDITNEAKYGVGPASTKNGLVMDGDKEATVLTVTNEGVVTVKEPEVLKTYTVESENLKDDDYIYTTIRIWHNHQTQLVVAQIIV